MGAIFFDLDGTLLDTLRDIRFYLNGMLRAHGYPERSEEETRAFIGDGARRLVERALPAGADAERCYAEFASAFSKSGGERTALYPDEMTVLTALREEYSLAVITNKPQAAADRVLSAFFPEGFFAFVGGDSGSFPCKPDPSLTRYAALRLRVPLSDCVFVGDGEADVQTARRAGMRCVSALWGYRTREQLLAAGATETVKNFPELYALLRKKSGENP